MKEIVLVYAPDISGSLDSVIEGLKRYTSTKAEMIKRYDKVECKIKCEFGQVYISIRGKAVDTDDAVKFYTSEMGKPIGTNYKDLNLIKRLSLNHQ